MADTTKNQRAELGSASFIGLLLTQFFTAFNDNMFRWLVVPVGQQMIGDTQALVWGAVFFTLPYLFLAPTAGFLADRFPKRRVMVICKFAEIIVMSLGCMAIYYGNVWVLLGLVLVMGAQSALFSPAKFGAIPEILSPAKLPTGNGLMAMVTIIACALGTAAGYLLFGLTHQEMTVPGKPIYYEFMTVWPAVCALVGVAVVGWVVSLIVKTGPAADPERPATINPISELTISFRQLAQNRALLNVAVGIAFFYFLALLFQVNIDAYGEHVLQMKKDNTGILVGMLVLGVGLGGVAAGVISGGRIQLGMIPFGAVGIAFSAIILGLFGYGFEAGNSGGISISAIWLFSLGLASGFFYVPLETYLQHHSPLRTRGAILAASNGLTNLFMLFAMAFFFALREIIKLSPSSVFLVTGLLAVPLVVITAYFVRQQCFRFCLWVVTRICYRVRLHGVENVPETGGAILVPNHVSWMDGQMLSALTPRHVRFMIYANFTQLWYLKALGEMMRVIPIKPELGPKEMMRSLKVASDAARDGELVCIFPEGGISKNGQLKPFQRGVMRILDKAKVPIIPVYIDGMWGSIFSYRRKLIWRKPDKFRSRVDITYGKPLEEIHEASQLQQVVQELGANVMQNNRSDLMIPIRKFVRQMKRSLFRMKVADSSGTEMTGGKLLAGTVAFKRVLEREVFDHDEKMVGILLPPSVGGVIANTAVAMSKRVTVNLNYTLTDDVMNYCIKEAGIKHVLTSRRFIEKKPVELDAELIFLEDLKEKVTSLDRAIGAAQAFGLPAAVIERIHGLTSIDRDDLATVIFTSGSTGEPKGVMLSHHNLASNIEAADRLYTLTKDDTLIGILPFFHSFGHTIGMMVVLTLDPAGAFHFNPLDARQIGKLAEKYKGTIIEATPTFLKTYVKRCTAEQFQHMRLVVVGAEKLQEDLAEAFVEKYGVRPIEGYGATELSPLAAANVPDVEERGGVHVGNKLGTVGQPIHGCTVKIVNPETGEELGREQEGLMKIAGPNVMLGYLNQPEKTAEVIQDGWYNTGDVALIDSDGFIKITGRQSRFSKIGGEMVPHIRVEEEIAAIVDALDPLADEAADVPGGVLRVAVTAVPDDKKGERLIAFHKPIGCSRDEIIARLSEGGLPNIWIPAAESFIQVDEIPLLGTGKLDLKAVKELAFERCSPQTA